MLGLCGCDRGHGRVALVAAVREQRNQYAVSTWVEPDARPAPLVYSPPQSELPTLADIALARTAHTGHARQDDDAITHAKATLLISGAYIVAAAMITIGLLLVVWLFRGLGERFAPYAYVGLIAWGLAILFALWGNRRQSLWHSPTGISHHEIDSREAIARHAIDTHADLLLAQWRMQDRGRDR